jgi:hypothetical protein
VRRPASRTIATRPGPLRPVQPLPVRS